MSDEADQMPVRKPDPTAIQGTFSDLERQARFVWQYGAEGTDAYDFAEAVLVLLAQEAAGEAPGDRDAEMCQPSSPAAVPLADHEPSEFGTSPGVKSERTEQSGLADHEAAIRRDRLAASGQSVDPEETLAALTAEMRANGCLCLYSRCPVHGESMGPLARSYVAIDALLAAARTAEKRAEGFESLAQVRMDEIDRIDVKWRTVGVIEAERDAAVERANQAEALADQRHEELESGYGNCVELTEALAKQRDAETERADRAERERDYQIGDKLAAQMTLKAVCESIDLPMVSLRDGWTKSTPLILARLEEIVDAGTGFADERDAALAEAVRLREALQGGVGLIATERSRQIEDERWTHYHDDGHEDGALALAAAVYALPEAERDQYIQVLVAASWTNRKLRFHLWPFGWNWFKPTPDDRVRELVKAGALIAAEIDRLARGALSAEQPEPAKQDERAWLIHFDDPDRPLEVFAGEGAAQAARARSEYVGQSWTHTLFMSAEQPEQRSKDGDD